jgi:hypothetical protein
MLKQDVATSISDENCYSRERDPKWFDFLGHGNNSMKVNLSVENG